MTDKEPEWPDVSPEGLRKMAEIAAPNNGRVFLAAAGRIEQAEAPSTTRLEAPSGCELKCTEVCKAKEHGCASECPALPWQPAATHPTASNAGERDWHAPGLGEVHASDHKAMIYCEAEGPDGEMIVSDELARRVCAALASKPPAGEQKRCPDDSVTPAYLDWLRTQARREGVGGNEAWNAGVEHGKTLAAPQPEQVAQDKEHAENYRWLLAWGDSLYVEWRHNCAHGPELDEAIRAARARGEGQS